MVKLKSSPFNVNIAVAYSATADADEQEINEFYKSLVQKMFTKLES